MSRVSIKSSGLAVCLCVTLFCCPSNAEQILHSVHKSHAQSQALVSKTAKTNVVSPHLLAHLAASTVEPLKSAEQAARDEPVTRVESAAHANPAEGHGLKPVNSLKASSGALMGSSAMMGSGVLMSFAMKTIKSLELFADLYSHQFFRTFSLEETAFSFLKTRTSRIAVACILSGVCIFAVIVMALYLQRLIVLKAHQDAKDEMTAASQRLAASNMKPTIMVVSDAGEADHLTSTDNFSGRPSNDHMPSPPIYFAMPANRAGTIQGNGNGGFKGQSQMV